MSEDAVAVAVEERDIRPQIAVSQTISTGFFLVIAGLLIGQPTWFSAGAMILLTGSNFFNMLGCWCLTGNSAKANAKGQQASSNKLWVKAHKWGLAGMGLVFLHVASRVVKQRQV